MSTQTLTISSGFNADTAVPVQIVPEAVKAIYKQGFTPTQLASLDQTFQEIRAQALNASKPANTRSKEDFTIDLIIGNAGSGKSYFKKGSGSVLCSTDDILEKIPEFVSLCNGAMSHAGHYSEAHSYVREQLGRATEAYRRAAQFMLADLVQDCANNKRSMRIEITGKSDGTADFIKNLKATGANLNVYVCLASNDVESKVSTARWESFRPICASPEDVQANHQAVLQNIPAILVAAGGSPVTILARYEVNEPLKDVVLFAADKTARMMATQDEQQRFSSTFGLPLESMVRRHIQDRSQMTLEQ